jgi:5-methyltetrahydrofolate--homocysteine methyltransferase
MTLDAENILAKKYGPPRRPHRSTRRAGGHGRVEVRVRKRIYDIWCSEYGSPADGPDVRPLVFPVVDRPGADPAKSAVETFEAIRLIKRNLPGALTHVGLSNCSFGLNPYTPAGAQLGLPALRLRVRPRLAILHAAKSCRWRRSTSRGQGTVPPALFDERVFDAAGNCVEDPLQLLIEHYADKKVREQEGAEPRETVRGAAAARRSSRVGGRA